MIVATAETAPIMMPISSAVVRPSFPPDDCAPELVFGPGLVPETELEPDPEPEPVPVPDVPVLFGLDDPVGVCCEPPSPPDGGSGLNTTL